MRRYAACILTLVSVTDCRHPAPEPPPTPNPTHQAYLRAGDLEVMIRDNEAFGSARPGYNGVAVLRHRREPRNLFVSRYSGLNLEHIFDGVRLPETDEELFEPRHVPMTLTRVSELTVELHQPPTPYHQLESRTTFTLTPPHYIDFTFECTPRADTYPRGYIGLFWASYIDAPENLAIQTIGRGLNEEELRWIQHASGAHDDRSTLRYVDERGRVPTFAEDHDPTLYINFAEQYYAYPFYYGRYDDMVYILMLDRTEGIRLTMSPAGAGRNDDGTTNPAWDWQWFIFDPEPEETYSYRARAVYKPWVSKADVIAEYEAWSGIQVELNPRGM